jgi:hypothetical protein
VLWILTGLRRADVSICTTGKFGKHFSFAFKTWWSSKMVKVAFRTNVIGTKVAALTIYRWLKICQKITLSDGATTFTVMTLISMTLGTMNYSRLNQAPVSVARGRIFSRVQPFYEQAVSDLDRSMHRSLRV